MSVNSLNSTSSSGSILPIAQESLQSTSRNRQTGTLGNTSVSFIEDADKAVVKLSKNVELSAKVLTDPVIQEKPVAYSGNVKLRHVKGKAVLVDTTPPAKKAIAKSAIAKGKEKGKAETSNLEKTVEVSIKLEGSQKKMAFKVSELAKALHTSEKDILQAQKDKKLDQFITGLAGTIESYQNIFENYPSGQDALSDVNLKYKDTSHISGIDLSSKQVADITSQALLTLDKLSSKKLEVNGLQDKKFTLLVGINEKGGVDIAKYGVELGKGTFGEVSDLERFEDKGDAGVIKLAKGDTKEELERANSDIEAEYKMLKDIHGSPGEKKIGIQEAPRAVTYMKDKEGGIKKGYIGAKYAGDCANKKGDNRFLKMSREDCRGVMKQVFTGLQTLKEKGIFHGDIKPHNMLYRGNDVDIADFGGAKKLSLDLPIKDFDRGACTEVTTCMKDQEEINRLKKEFKDEKLKLVMMRCPKKVADEIIKLQEKSKKISSSIALNRQQFSAERRKDRPNEKKLDELSQKIKKENNEMNAGDQKISEAVDRYLSENKTLGEEGKKLEDGYKETIQKILHKGDVFSLAVSLGHMFTGIYVPQINPELTPNHQLMRSFDMKLKEKFPDTSQGEDPLFTLIKRGLSLDYERRPIPETFLKALSS